MDDLLSKRMTVYHKQMYFCEPFIFLSPHTYLDFKIQILCSPLNGYIKFWMMENPVARENRGMIGFAKKGQNHPFFSFS